MKLLIDPRVKKFIQKLPKRDSRKVTEYIDLFEEFGFGLDERYLKKVVHNLWELRPRSIRLFLTTVDPNTIVIHAMYKKSQRITTKTFRLLNQRLKDYFK